MRLEEVLFKCVHNKSLPHRPCSGDAAVTVISSFVKWRRIIATPIFIIHTIYIVRLSTVPGPWGELSRWGRFSPWVLDLSEHLIHSQGRWVMLPNKQSPELRGLKHQG